jgi:hypothetical protein
MTPLVAHIWTVRAKLKGGKKRYGSYPAGSLEKFRLLMGVHIDDPVLHVCGGLVRYYPYERAFGPNDKTLDLDESTEPDFLQDARKPYPKGFKAIIMDPDYTAADAAVRPMGAGTMPNPRVMLRLALDALKPGRRVGILHEVVPSPPTIEQGKGERRKPTALFVAKIDVGIGFNNRERVFSVFEKL